jgi:anti-anti-sigma factor
MLQVREHQHHSTKVLTLSGHFTHDTATGIQARILGAKEARCQHLILDFSGMTEIDPRGIGDLLYWYHNIKPYFVQVSIVNPPTPIWNQLDMGHVSELVPIYASQEEATWNNVPYS